MSDRTYTLVIAVVTAVWAGSNVAGILQLNDYQPSESVNGIFMAVVGGAFALKNRRGGDDKK